MKWPLSLPHEDAPTLAPLRLACQGIWRERRAPGFVPGTGLGYSTDAIGPAFGARRRRSSVKRWLLQPRSPAERGLTMKIVIIGGSGLIGSKVVALLREHGHEAVP